MRDAGPTFPLVAELWDGRTSRPPQPNAFAIFDAKGYWASFGGIRFQLPSKDPANERIVSDVTRMLNAAYEQGRMAERASIRDKVSDALDVLGIKHEG